MCCVCTHSSSTPPTWLLHSCTVLSHMFCPGSACGVQCAKPSLLASDTQATNQRVLYNRSRTSSGVPSCLFYCLKDADIRSSKCSDCAWSSRCGELYSGALPLLVKALAVGPQHVYLAIQLLGALVRPVSIQEISPGTVASTAVFVYDACGRCRW